MHFSFAVLPSPPMSDVQSHRASQYGNSAPSSPLSQHSQTMDIDDQARFHNEGDHHDNTLSPQESSNTGFLAHTGRRTTVHFPHGLGDTYTAGKPEIIAPTPIRRSQSQELLNADYSNFKVSAGWPLQSQAPRQASKHVAVPPKTSSTAWSDDRPPHQEGGTPARGIKMSQSSRAATSPYFAPSSTKQMGKPSSLRKIWDPAVSTAYNASKVDDFPLGVDRPVDVKHKSRPMTMQRSSSHSQLSGGLHTSRPDIGGSSFNSQQFTAMGGGWTFSLPLDPNASRRASLPDSLYPAQLLASTRPSTERPSSAFVHKVSFQRQKSIRRATTEVPAPVTDVDMADDESSSDQGDTIWTATHAGQTTPKRTTRERTLRRLKSSPSGEHGLSSYSLTGSIRLIVYHFNRLGRSVQNPQCISRYREALRRLASARRRPFTSCWLRQAWPDLMAQFACQAKCIFIGPASLFDRSL